MKLEIYHTKLNFNDSNVYYNMNNTNNFIKLTNYTNELRIYPR